MRDGYAVLVNGPEDGATVHVGSRPPRKLEFAENQRLARYVRCTRLNFDVFRSSGCGQIGQVTYRFKGYVQEPNACSP